MRQVLQKLNKGGTETPEVPCPQALPGHLLIRTRRTLISTGTERALVEFSKANIVDKARQQPDKARMVLDKIRTDGVIPTLEAIRSKLDQFVPLGYCNVGEVLEVGKGVEGFEVGDRVVSNGKHAEVVCVPKNLCAKVPIGVADDVAAFTVLGAIALEGARLARPTLGEVIVVTGLGLIGLIAIQLLRAHGCRVLGIDSDPPRVELARRFGIEAVDLSNGRDPLAIAQAFSRGRGVDAVIICASTESNEPLHQAARMCRKRGRIVLVGVSGLDLCRADFYEKELSFQVSCSYGPGRYDPDYEEKGQDYPVGFVRWTAQRNFEAVLDMIVDGRLDVEALISHHFRIEEADKAYELIASKDPSLAIILQYPSSIEKSNSTLQNSTVRLLEPSRPMPTSMPVLSFVGAGNYATSVLIPAFKRTGVQFKSIASSRGVSGYYAGRKFGFEETTADTESVFTDPQINAVVITTRHDSHASLVCRALEAGKHVFVEKPLCLSDTELQEICKSYASSLMPYPSGLLLMAGFNRRFAPQVLKIKKLLTHCKEPKVFIMTVNAGPVPPDHWTRDPAVGGGRIIGEACHFVDLLRFLAAASVVSIQASQLTQSKSGIVPDDRASFTLSFADGSCGTVHYLPNGHRSFPKERLEVFCGGGILQLDNFRRLRGYGWPGFRRMNLLRQDKGNRACVAAFVDAIREGKPAPIPFEELVEVTRVTLDVAKAL